jgi:two-component system, NtrC family, sensor kinase
MSLTRKASSAAKKPMKRPGRNLAAALAEREAELAEARRQHAATAEILNVISRSPTDAAPVFETILEACQRLFGSDEIGVYTIGDDDMVRVAAWLGPRAEEVRRDVTPFAESVTGRIILERRIHHIPDLRDEPNLSPTVRERVKRLGSASLLYAPMLWEDRGLGSILVARSPPRPFSDREQALLQTFADQAAIAIENARLFRENKEALRRQTATADVLKAISRSAFDLDAVLDTLISTALRLCGAKYGQIFRRHGDVYRYAASRMEVADAYREHEKNVEIRPGRGTLVGRVAMEKRAVEIADAWNDEEYAEKDEARIGNVRAMLGVPLLRNGEPIGAFALARGEPVPFTQRQVELVTTFADQAVIAIENVRLFDEVQARTRDLAEALQQQTATADVLKVISRSAFDLDLAASTILEAAARLCRAPMAALHLRDGDVCRLARQFGLPEAFEREMRENPLPVRYPLHTRRTARAGDVAHYSDAWSDPDYLYKSSARLGGYRAIIVIPLMGEGELVGIFSLGRPEPEPFTESQIKLTQTFADQAAIAIENARLFEEVQARTRDLTEALQMQTATSDVLKVISRSAFDLQTVFNTLVSSAVELGGALTGTICVRDGDVFRYRDTIGAEHTSALAQYLRDHPATPGRSTIAGRVLLSGKVERIPDCLADPEYVVPMGSLATNVRSLLGVPLLRKEGVEGAIILTRAEPGEFTDRQIEIVQTFADQAVIALENVRLFDEVQARTRELAASLDDLRKAQDRLIQSEKLASLGQLTAGIAHEIKNPLNFVNNFSALSRELIGELADVIKAAPLDDARREEAEELIGTIGGNLDKVVSHGKRADSIVKNMLLHSRDGSGERSPTNINAMVDEALNLAYHGARAEKPGFNVTIVKSLDPGAGDAEVYAQEMTRVLLNLISNGFYATTKRRQAEPDGTYEPTLTATTRDLGKSVEIAIRDNGTGIPDEVKEKMFNPFFTTKPAGEGTGLGLSLSHDIVVKQHGGTLEVSTEPGAYTEFTIALPRAGAGR